MLYADPFLTVYCCLLAALLGACMGSFLNCAAWRIVHGESVLRGRSHCDACGHVLAVRDLIPVVSYLAAHGRCRYCGAKLSRRHVLAEPLTVSLFRYGEFTSDDSRMVGYALTAMCIGVPAFMLSKVLLSAFYSRKDTRTPMRAAIWTVVINVILIAVLVTPMWKMGLPFAHAGIAAATAIAGTFNAALLWRWLRRPRGEPAE